MVCWDCDGIVVEKNSLELHYADSSVHPTCAFCGVGARNLADMDEVCFDRHAVGKHVTYNPTQHVRHMHTTRTEMDDHPGGGDVSVSVI